jgi:hypothetical protein
LFPQKPNTNISCFLVKIIGKTLMRLRRRNKDKNQRDKNLTPIDWSSFPSGQKGLSEGTTGDVY